MADVEDFFDQGVYLSENEGDHSKLIESLRSNVQLTPHTREHIAKILEGGITRKRGRRPNPVFENTTPGDLARERIFLTFATEKARLRVQEPIGRRDIDQEAIHNSAIKLRTVPGEVSRVLYPRKGDPEKPDFSYWPDDLLIDIAKSAGLESKKEQREFLRILSRKN